MRRTFVARSETAHRKGRDNASDRMQKVGNRVLVEKYSPTHTSTQWVEDAKSRCAEFRAQAERGVRSTDVPVHPLRNTVARRSERAPRESGRSCPTPDRRMKSDRTQSSEQDSLWFRLGFHAAPTRASTSNTY